MRILVLGANGMLGHKLVELLSTSLEVWGTVRSSEHVPLLKNVLGGSRIIEPVTADDARTLVDALDRSRPEVVLNCVGLVKQRTEAGNPTASRRVNALFPHQLKVLCENADSRLIHFSTDCVFSGNRGGYTEEDPPDPVDLYGRTKLEGEVTGPGVLTLRTSMIGWELSGSLGLLEWLAEQKGGRVQGYRRAIFSGLSTAAIAQAVMDILARPSPLEGLYHLSAAPITKLELIDRLIQALDWSIDIEVADQPRIDRSLDSTAFRSMIAQWNPPTWDAMISGLAAERPSYEALRKG